MKVNEWIDNIFAGSQNPIAEAEYIKINLNIEQISKIFNLLLTKLTTTGIILPCVIITAINYFIFDLGEDSFYLPIPVMYVWNFISYKRDQVITIFFFRTPFNWKTPFGYLILLSFVCSSVLSMAFCMLPIACFVIGSYLLMISIIKDITKNDFRILSDGISNENFLGMSRQFCSLMQKFSQLKQLSWIW